MMLVDIVLKSRMLILNFKHDIVFSKGGNLMDIRVLEYFLMAAREENITKAAQLLHVTQPTLSRQLMQ